MSLDPKKIIDPKSILQGSAKALNAIKDHPLITIVLFVTGITAMKYFSHYFTFLSNSEVVGQSFEANTTVESQAPLEQPAATAVVGSHVSLEEAVDSEQEMLFKRQRASIEKMQKAIDKIKRQCTTQNTAAALSLAYNIMEYIPRVEAIIALYKQDASNRSWRKQAKELLFDRWLSVKHTSFCYSLNPEHIINKIFYYLAELIDPREVNHLLMPTVDLVDIYRNQLNELSLGQFIITDNATHFIVISDIVDTWCEWIEQSEKDLKRFSDKDGNVHSLSENEYQQLRPIMIEVEKYRQALSRTENGKAAVFYNQLILLRDGLRKGDAIHGSGTEHEAGKEAGIAVAAFFDYFHSLTEVEKETWCKLNDVSGCHNLGVILGVLGLNEEDARDQEKENMRHHCLFFRGDDIQAIIDHNKPQLLDTSTISLNKFDKLKQAIKDVPNKKSLLTPLLGRNPSNKETLMALSKLFSEHAEVENDPNRLNECFIDIALFIIRQIEKIVDHPNTSDFVKLGWYVDMLIAMHLELSKFRTREPYAKNIMMQVICERLAMLNAIQFSTGRPLFNKVRSSFEDWQHFLDENPAICSFLSTTYRVVSFEEYIMKYPKETQRVFNDMRIMQTEELAARYLLNGDEPCSSSSSVRYPEWRPS